MKKLTLALFLIASTVFAQANPFEVSVEPPEDGKLSVIFKAPEKHYLYADQIMVSVNGKEAEPVSAPQPVSKLDPVTGEDVLVFTGRTRVEYSVDADVESYIVEVSYMGCNDMLCFAPAGEKFEFGAAEEPDRVSSEKPLEDSPDALLDGFRIAGTTSGYMQEEAFLKFLNGSLEGGDAGGDRLADKGIVLTLLLILLGGLALNLTPCVLPMIPINIAIIGAGVGAGSKSRGFLLGGAYGAGIALVYGALGLVVMLTGSTFGTLNSSPWFNIAVAVIFIVLSLSMFGVFNIDFSNLQGKVKAGDKSKGKVVVSFFLGGVAALLAGACVAPVVISVLLLAADFYQKGNVAGLLLPFVLGLGMALPWPFAGAGVSFLPKPGAWMEKIKYAFGIIILIGAGYYALLGISLLQDRSEHRRFEVVEAQQKRIEEGWYTSLDEALSVSRLNGKPVFVDFWASWCKNCLKMEKTTFKSESVAERLDSFVKVKYRAEKPNDPATRAVLDEFGVVGLPTYTVLMPE